MHALSEWDGLMCWITIGSAGVNGGGVEVINMDAHAMCPLENKNITMDAISGPRGELYRTCDLAVQCRVSPAPVTKQKAIAAVFSR